MKNKPAWLWVTTYDDSGLFFAANLFFSSRKKFREVSGRDNETLISIIVRADFDDWDYIPDNY